MEEFLKKRFGSRYGMELYHEMEKRRADLLGRAAGKTESQKKVLKETILPRVALYQILLENEETAPDAGKIIEDYVLTDVGMKQHKRYAAFEKIPFFYQIFSKAFGGSVASSDLWDADIDKSSKDCLKVTMHRCFWNDAYIEYGCPELCKYCCRCDEVTYNGLKKVRFERTQTLATGGTCCDFKFSKKK